MKKNYNKPVIKAYKISVNTILAGSNEPAVYSNQAESGSEGLSKKSNWYFDDEEEE